MPEYRLRVRRLVAERGVVFITAETAEDATNLWLDRDDDDAFGCGWFGGDVADHGIDHISSGDDHANH